MPTRTDPDYLVAPSPLERAEESDCAADARPLPDHLVRLPRRPAQRGVPRPTSTRSSATRSTSTSPSASRDARAAPDHGQRGVRRRVVRARTRKASRAAGTPRDRDKELDADGVAGEVHLPRRRRGARRRLGAVRRRPRHRRPTVDPELLMAGARAHNRWLAELCADSPERRAGVALVPILHDVDAAVAEIRRARESGLRGGILIPSMWVTVPAVPRRRATTRCGRCARSSQMPVHTHSGAAPTRTTVRRRTSASTPPRCAGGRRARSGSCSGRACSSATRDCIRRHRVRRVLGCPTCCG